MRRNPLHVPLSFESGGKRPTRTRVDDAGGLKPFLVSGGRTIYVLQDGPPTFDPRAGAVQLLASVYVNKGEIGFLKSLRVAPYMPAVFSTDPISNDVLRWRTQDASLGEHLNRPPATGGLWETPAGWEGYYNALDLEAKPPRWTWQLRIFQGSIDELRLTRRNVPPFNPGDPTSWFLVPDIPVPAGTYRAGLPGKAVGFPFPGQRFQLLPGDGLLLHIPIPEDSTLCLFAEWTQTAIPAYARTTGGTMLIDGERQYYPLLPSFGQLAGYSLPKNEPTAIELSKAGW
jgi:hypothetical protein